MMDLLASTTTPLTPVPPTSTAYDTAALCKYFNGTIMGERREIGLLRSFPSTRPMRELSKKSGFGHSSSV